MTTAFPPMTYLRTTGSSIMEVVVVSVVTVVGPVVVSVVGVAVPVVDVAVPVVVVVLVVVVVVVVVVGDIVVAGMTVIITVSLALAPHRDVTTTVTLWVPPTSSA
ncbi:MAG: hypothetical protein ACTSPE_12200 [Candidatus Thorarchaeota archaeon]